MDAPPVLSVDGNLFLAHEARITAKRYYIAGFFGLPWFWACNIWLFFPDFVHGTDPVVKQYTRKSALWFVVYTALLLPWTLTYLIGGASVLGTKTYKDLDIMNVDLASAGIGG